MKTMISAVLLSLGSSVSMAQTPSVPFMGSQLEIGYSRETVKIRDEQASPMLYVANLNGVRLGYTRQTLRNQWRIGVQAGLGDLIAPSLGIRPFKFVPDQDQPLWVAPELYRGTIELEYRRVIRQTATRSTWLGLGLHETIGYADGLALNTWAFNNADIRLLYQTRITLGRRHTLSMDALLPVLAAVSRMPYSNVVSQPNRSEVAAFFSNTRLATLNQYLNPELGMGYRFALGQRVAFNVGYRYSWMRYSEPQLIRSANHALQASILYQFQPQSR